VNSFFSCREIQRLLCLRSVARRGFALPMLLCLAVLSDVFGLKNTSADERKEWGAGVLLSFPIIRDTDFLSRMDIIPYFFLAPEEAKMQGQNISFMLEPKVVFRVNLESGNLQSAKFKIGTKAVVKDLRLESDPIIVISTSGQAAVFDAQTLIPRLNGLTHKDLTVALETTQEKILASMNGSPAKVDAAAIQLVISHCQERRQGDSVPLGSSAFPIEVLAHRELNVLSPAAGVRAVFDHETRVKIERAWLDGVFNDPTLLETIPNLKLELLYPWRTE